MKNFMNQLMYKLAKFLNGRYITYGRDRLSNFLMYLTIIILIISIFIKSIFFTIIIYALLIYSLYRDLSKNIYKRQNELRIFNNLIKPFDNIIKLFKLRINDKNNNYYLCSCGTILRLPKNQGKIEITCPKCKKKITKRT